VVEDEMDVDMDVPVHDRSPSRVSVRDVDFSDAGWPAGYRMGSSPLSKVEGVASPSGLTTEEKEKTPREMEIEDVAGPLGDPTANAKPVKMEEVPVDVNWVKYKVMEVLPREPAQPVIEGAPAEEGTQPVATKAEGEAEVEPKPEPVKLRMPLPTVELTNTQMKELKITTHKNKKGKEVIEILDSDDEMPVEVKGKEKEPDEEPEEEKAPDS
jgi:hypothetical protein